MEPVPHSPSTSNSALLIAMYELVALSDKHYRDTQVIQEEIASKSLPAMQEERKTKVVELLNAGADPNYRTGSYNNPFELALQHGDEDLVRQFIATPQDVNRTPVNYERHAYVVGLMHNKQISNATKEAVMLNMSKNRPECALFCANDTKLEQKVREQLLKECAHTDLPAAIKISNDNKLLDKQFREELVTKLGETRPHQAFTTARQYDLLDQDFQKKMLKKLVSIDPQQAFDLASTNKLFDETELQETLLKSAEQNPHHAFKESMERNWFDDEKRTGWLKRYADISPGEGLKLALKHNLLDHQTRIKYATNYAGYNADEALQIAEKNKLLDKHDGSILFKALGEMDNSTLFSYAKMNEFDLAVQEQLLQRIGKASPKDAIDLSLKHQVLGEEFRHSMAQQIEEEARKAQEQRMKEETLDKESRLLPSMREALKKALNPNFVPAEKPASENVVQLAPHLPAKPAEKDLGSSVA